MKKLNYSKEHCKKEALKYIRRIDFQKKSTSIYKFIQKNNWLDEICSHMRAIKANNYWNFDECQKEALKYNKRSVFRKCSGSAYSAARINNWLNQICAHMIIFSKPQKYWTKEKCHEMALKCEYRSEFFKRFRTAYSAAFKKNWLDEICSHMKIIGNRYKRCIYAYEFSDNHVYVGLTYNLDKRNINRKLNKRDQVTKYIKKTGLIPTIKKLSKYLPISEASKLEKYYVEKYKDNKWIILNKIKAGGVGGKNVIWTYERTKEVALNYIKKIDFRKDKGGAYAAAWRNGWLDEICVHMINGNRPKNYWTKELCEIESKKYKSRIEFLLKNRSAYEASNKNEWMNDFFRK
jgi:predicted GIY-YIG superfamily endonuclease